MTITVNGQPMEAGCYVSDRMTADDMCREAIRLAQDFGFEVDSSDLPIVDPYGWAPSAEYSEDLYRLCDSVAVPWLNDHTIGGSWSFDGERGGFFLDNDEVAGND